MYRREASEESLTRHVHRQLPESLLVNFRDHKLSDSSQFISYSQALKWIKQKHLCLQKFINILKLYPSLIQENAYDPFWTFIQPLLPTSRAGKISSPAPDSNLRLGFSSATSSVSSVNLSNDQFSVAAVTDSTTINCTLEASSETSSSWKKENFLSRNPNLIQQPKFNQSLSLHGKGIVNIPSIFVSTESSLKDSPNNETSPKAYSSKVFLCKDVTDIEDSMSMAVLTSLSSVSFVHCLPPTMQPVKSIIPECDAFIFIMNNFTVSVSDCLLQLKQAQLLHLPIQFIRYHDFQLPQNLEEIVKVSLASDTNLDQYLSIRRRSYITSPTSSIRGSCSSDREASPDRSCSPLLYREQRRNVLPSLPLSGNSNSENNNSKSTAGIISMLVSCLKDGYQKAHLYNSKCHLACVSQIIDSVSNLLESPLSYNTAYFQLKKKKQPDQHSLPSRPTVSKVCFHSSYEPHSNAQTRSKRLQIQKHKKAPKASNSNCKNYPDTENLILNVPIQQSKSKRNHSSRRQWQVPFHKDSPQISPDSSDYHSPTDPAGIIRLKTMPFEDSDNEDEDDDEEEEEESSLKFPSLQDSSQDKYISEGKETSYVVYPDSNLTSDKKPTVIKWPLPLNQERQLKGQDSLRDETDSNSTNFFDVDLTKELYTSSDED